MEGWIKLHRKIIEWEWYDDANTFRLFLHLLLKANCDDNNWRGLTIRRGQLFTSIKHLSSELKISEKSIRNGLLRLSKSGELGIQGASHGTMVTINKYEDYQQIKESKGKPSGEQGANEGQTKGDKQEEEEYKRKEEYKKQLLSKIDISDFPTLNFEYLEAAKSFQNLFRSNLQDAGASTDSVDKAKGTWVDDIRLIIETDKYSIDDLRAAYKFLQNSAFWKKNILSTSKLREKMAKIKLELKNGNSRSTTKEATSWNELAEVVRDAFGS